MNKNPKISFLRGMNEQPNLPQNGPTQSKVFQQKIDPMKIAGIMLAACFVFGGLSKLADLAGFGMNDRLIPWTFALSFLLLYAVAGSLFTLTADSDLKYFGRSIYAFLGLAIVNGLIAWLFSGIKIGEAGSYKSLYLVVAIGFLVFISIVNAMKGIVKFAQKEEWNQPRFKGKR